MGRKLGVAIVPVEDPKDAVTGSNLVLGRPTPTRPFTMVIETEPGALAISLRNSDRYKDPASSTTRSSKEAPLS
jgi:hypothetical protein